MLKSKRAFTLTLAVLVLFGCIATSLIGYFVARQSITEHLQQQTLPLSSDNIYSEIQRDLLQPLLISSLMANDTFVIDWVKNGEQETQAIASYLAQIKEKYQTITAFFVSDISRNYYHPTGILKQVSPSNPADDWYFNVRDLQVDYDINIDWDTADTSRLSIFVNYRVKDAEGQLMGVTGVGLSMDSVIQLIESYQRRYNREVYFADRQGLITLRGKQYQQVESLYDKIRSTALVEALLSQPTASLTYQTAAGEMSYLNSRLVTEFDWFLIVEQWNHPAAKKLRSALWMNLVLSLLISLMVLAIVHQVLRHYQHRLEEMATIDKLTGATSRQVFDHLFERVRKISQRRNEPVSLICFDIDHFKRINDSYGHVSGDVILQQVASTTQALIREADTLCRWGGEEFLILLPGCQVEDASEVAEKLRLAIAGQVFQFRGEQLSVTVSAGVTQYRPGESLAQLLERCDQALYQSKRAGRNKTTTV